MKKLVSLFLLLIVLAVSGCTPWMVTETVLTQWTRIPESPVYTVEEPIPLRVGVIFLRDRSEITLSHIDVIKALQEIQLFDSLVYPYQEGDPVDAVLRLTISGGNEGESALSRFGVETLSLVTIGLSGPLVGRSATFKHNVLAVLNQSSDEIGRYSVEVSSTVGWGTGPISSKENVWGQGSGNALMDQAIKDKKKRLFQRRASSIAAGYKLQRKRIAFELAKKIRADRQNLLSTLNKSQEEVTAP